MARRHSAAASPRGRVSDKGVRFCWDDAQCGAWSGYRYKTIEAAEAGAERHNETAAEQDRQVDRLLYGRGKRSSSGPRAD